MSLTAALTLSRQGFAVFPVVGKRPLTPKGVYSASADPKVFCCFDWGRGVDCGVATGAVSGIDVLDVDVRGCGLSREDQESSSCDGGDGSLVGGVNGFATLARLGALPETLVASTPNAGRHYWFRHVDGSRNRRLGDGLEWFTTGKLVVVPPARGREWLNAGAPIAEAPEWLKAFVLAPSHMGEGRNSSGPQVTNRNGDRNGEGDTRVPRPVYLRLLRLMRGAEPRAQRRARALYNLLASKQRERNDALNFVAYQFRELIADGAIEVEGACELLVMASQANGYLAKDGEEAVRGTITSGLGLEEPQS
jgi:Bifunctional DNA primase/polymerase, N-terminal